MAVDAEEPFCCENLVLPTGRKHYKIGVESKHWQLRSLISVSGKHIYAPGGPFNNHILQFDPETRQYETIKMFPFVPRCLVAKNGWVCCGSESGHFSASRLDQVHKGKAKDSDDSPNVEMTEEDGSSSDQSRGGSNSQVREGPFGVHDESGSSSRMFRSSSPARGLHAKTIKIAGSRVNCITLWFPPKHKTACPQSYKEPVAVLANNDRTVTVVSLEQFEANEKVEPLASITYPDYVNRAVLSPDGSTIVAVLDDPYLYVHTLTSEAPMGFNKRKWTDVRWELRARWLLKSQKRNDKAVARGSFAACFSNSGDVLAVGTQYGTICIFNSIMLTEPGTDPLVTHFQSSRPNTQQGAIRDMAFCPGFGDLLAWTEDRGRVGVIDIRTKYQVRQVLDITERDKFESVDVERRSFSRRDEGRPSGDGDGQRERDNEWPSRGRNDNGLDPNDSLFLGALRGSRRSPGARGRVTLHAWDSPSRELLRRTPIGDASVIGGSRSNGSNMYAAIETLTELRHRIRMDQTMMLGQGRPADNSTTDRARSSNTHSMLSAAHSRDIHRLLSYARRGETSTVPPAPPTLPPPPAQRPDPSARLMGRTRPTDNDFTDLIGWDGERDTDSDRDRDRDGEGEGEGDGRRNRERPLEIDADMLFNESMLLRLNDPPIFEVPPSPDNTSGLAWSAAGDILYVAAENGIYEFRVNINGRRFFSSISMR